MPSLHPVTVAELRASLTEAELKALPQSVGGVEADAWLAQLIEQACDRVIGAINACERNARIASGLSRVPAECVRVALVLARHAVISAVPGLSAVLEGSTRAEEYATAVKDLAALAACELLPLYTLEEEEQAADEGPGCVSILTKPDNWMI